MKKINNFISYTTIAALIFWSFVFYHGYLSYQGSPLYYVTFSIAFLAVIFLAFYKIDSYGFTFIAITMWAGFWLKFTLHSIFKYTYQEPLGKFVPSIKSYDEVLLVSTTAAVAIATARICYLLIKKPQDQPRFDINSKAPTWYPFVQKKLWFALTLLAVICCVANIHYGIQQAGLVPRTIFPWPINSVVYLLQVAGFPIAGACLLWWDQSLDRGNQATTYLFLFQGWLSSIAILSRGLYLFSVLPILFALLISKKNNAYLPIKKSIPIALCFCLFFATSILAVSQFRNIYYSTDYSASASANANTSANANVSASANVSTSTTVSPHYITPPNPHTVFPLFLAIERWIGIEGVMAVVAQPHKDLGFLQKGLMEKPEISKLGMYQSICQSDYRFYDLRHYQFVSLPGITAFLYYSNSITIVFAALFALITLLLFTESIIYRLTGNPLIKAFWGFATANFITQAGVTPRSALPYFLWVTLLVIGCTIIKSKGFEGFVVRACKLRTEIHS